MVRSLVLLVAATAAIGLVASCSEVNTTPCAPGEQQACVCEPAGSGYQTCNDEGTAFGACQCGQGGSGAGVSNGGDGNGAGTADGGGGAAPCTPGRSTPCYTGPAGTLDEGLCHEGISTCEGDGTPGPCLGEVTPTLESCTTVEDEDCNGSSPPCEDLWSVSFAATGTLTPSYVRTDDAGNIYVAGTFTETLDLGGSVLQAIGTDDIFVAKLDAAGNHVWSKSFGEPTDYLFLFGFDVSGDGHIALSGIFYDHLDLDGTLLETDDSAAFLAVLDTAGDVEWSVVPEGDVNVVTPAAFDASGGVTFGVTGSSLYFGGVDVYTGTALARFDSMGAYVDSFGFLPTASMLGLDLAPNGDVIFQTGNPGNLIDFGDGPVQISAGIVLARLDDTFGHVFSNGFPAQLVAPLTMAAGPSGEIAIAGNGSNQIDFDGNIVTSGATQNEGFAAVLEPSGAYRFAKFFDANNSEVATRLQDIAFGSGGNVVTVGTLLVANTDIGGTTYDPIGVDDALVVHLSAAGSAVAVGHYGGAETTAEAFGVAVHPTGSFVVIGRYAGASASAEGPDFGQGPLPGGAGMHGYLARVAP